MEEKKKIQIPMPVFITIAVILCVIGGVGGWFVGTKLADKESANTEEKQNNNSNNNNDNDNPSIALGQPVDKFTYSFLQLENKKENMIYSPLSIKYALKMASNGAAGNTKSEIDDLIGDLRFPKYKDVEEHLSVANAMFVRESFKDYIKGSYTKDNIEQLGAELKYDTFENANNINDWINKKTLGLINKAVDDSALTPETQLILANALGIKMDWMYKFYDEDTYGDKFYLSDGSEYEATTMHNEYGDENTSYYKDSKLQVITLSLKKYENTQLEFMAIMPENLEEYVKNIKESDIKELDSKLIKANVPKKGVELSIPKFKFDYQLQLTEDLQALGIKDAFNANKADFSKISDESMFISNTIHKALIDFSEEGVKAAAITVITMATTSVPEEDPNKPIVININKPFMFIIRDKDTKEVWFTGTVYKPNSWEDDKDDYKEAID